MATAAALHLPTSQTALDRRLRATVENMQPMYMVGLKAFASRRVDLRQIAGFVPARCSPVCAAGAQHATAPALARGATSTSSADENEEAIHLGKHEHLNAAQIDAAWRITDDQELAHWHQCASAVVK